jgi:hypothetical protein
MESKEIILNEKIYGFYHVCCLGNWQDIVCQQVKSLVRSPLYSKLDKVYVCVITSDSKKNDLNYCNEIFPEKFVISIIDNDFASFEYPILRLLQQKSKEEDFYCFYFHSKGVTTNKKKNGVTYWRKEMEYFIFYKYHLAIESFQLGFNTYGANLRAFPRWNNPHFCGNFWFAKSSYIKTLPVIPLHITDRYFAEEWIGKNKEMCPYVPYNTFIDLYHVPLPRLFYNKTLPVRSKDIVELISFVYYKIRGFLYKKQDKE